MLGGMYGGGMGGMGMGMGGLGGGMYGSGMGMGMSGLGGGMYGSGMGMGMSGLGGGMYGSGMGMGGMGTGMMTGSNFGGNGLLNSNTNNLGGNGLTDLQATQGQPGQPGLLPAPGDQPASPINQLSAPLPPLNETPEERGRRITAERRREQHLIRQQRDQRKQMRLQAKMEVAGHLTNVLVQTLRSTMELFAVCFGTYYSMKAVRAFANTQEVMSSGQFRRGPMGQMIPVNGPPTTSGVAAAIPKASPSQAAGPSRWKSWLLFGVLFLVGEIVYAAIGRSPNNDKRTRRNARKLKYEDAYGSVITQDELETSSAESLDLTAETDDDAMLYEGGGVGRKIFVAAYDYSSPQPDGGYLSFKAGDEFIVDDFVEGTWCEATNVTCSRHEGAIERGLVPSNFLRLVNTATKL